MSRIRQLAMDWQVIADQDASDARRKYGHYMPDVQAMQARTRRNCAWELMKMLDELEKENPASAGPLPPLTADAKSA
jgi:hypothetical protein